MLSPEQQAKLERRLQHNENHLRSLNEKLTAVMAEQSRVNKEFFHLQKQIDQGNEISYSLRDELMEFEGEQL